MIPCEWCLCASFSLSPSHAPLPLAKLPPLWLEHPLPLCDQYLTALFQKELWVINASKQQVSWFTRLCLTSSYLLFPEHRFFFSRRVFIYIENRDKEIYTQFLLVLTLQVVLLWLCYQLIPKTATHCVPRGLDVVRYNLCCNTPHLKHNFHKGALLL